MKQLQYGLLISALLLAACTYQPKAPKEQAQAPQQTMPSRVAEQEQGVHEVAEQAVTKMKEVTQEKPTTSEVVRNMQEQKEYEKRLDQKISNISTEIKNLENKVKTVPVDKQKALQTQITEYKKERTNLMTRDQMMKDQQIEHWSSVKKDWDKLEADANSLWYKVQQRTREASKTPEVPTKSNKPS